MKTENLKEGMVIQNYKRLCEILCEEIKSGKSKKLQIEEWERHFSFSRNKNKYIVEEIFLVPLERINNKRGGSSFGINNGNWINYPNLIVDSSKYNNNGIYKITLGSDIYIGSTTIGFRKRFQQHNSGQSELMKHTKDLLDNGGMFEILHDMTDVEDVKLIRMVENEFIKIYLFDSNWNLVNKKDGSLSYSGYYSDKYKIIRVSENNYYEAIQLLLKNGLIEDEEVEV